MFPEYGYITNLICGILLRTRATADTQLWLETWGCFIPRIYKTEQPIQYSCSNWNYMYKNVESVRYIELQRWLSMTSGLRRTPATSAIIVISFFTIQKMVLCSIRTSKYTIITMISRVDIFVELLLLFLPILNCTSYWFIIVSHCCGK